MPLWGTSDSANSAPTFVTNAGNGNTGITDYGTEILQVFGTEGYPVPPGWARKYTKGNRTIWESLVVFGVGGNASAAQYAPYAAPAGYHWEFVTLNNSVVENSAGPLVILQGN